MSTFLADAGDLPAAEFSPCRIWRYVLRRRWGAGPVLGWGEPGHPLYLRGDLKPFPLSRREP